MEKLKYNINHYVAKLPREINVEELCRILKRHGISRDSFFRDRKAPYTSAQCIDTDRLLVYAKLFGCSVEELINKKPLKIKPLIHNEN